MNTDFNENKFKAIIEQSANTIIIVGVNGLIEYTNPKFTEVLGYTAEEVKGKNPRFLNIDLQSDEFQEKIWKTISAGNVWKGEFLNRSKSGKIVSEQATITPIKNDKGEIISYLTVTEKITELLETKERINTLINAFPNPIFYKDGLGKLAAYNKAGIALFNLKGIDVIGKTDSEIAECADECFKEALHYCEASDAKVWEQNKTVISEEIIPTLEGDLKTYNVKKIPIFNDNGSRKGLLTILNDITENKRNQERILKHKLLFETMYNSINDGVVITDTERKIILVNKKMCETFGYSQKEILGKNKTFLFSNNECYLNFTNQFFSNTCKVSESLYETNFKTKKGEIFPGEAYGTELIDVNEKWIGNLVVIKNIASRKYNEQLIQQAKNNLEKNEKQLIRSQSVAKLGHYVLDINNDKWTNSEELNNIFGISKDFDRTIANWATIIHPEDRDEMVNHILTHVIKNKNDFDRHYRIINKKTGNEHWVHGKGNLKFNAKNEPIEMFGTIQDITEQKNIELQLHEAKILTEENEKLLALSQSVAKLGHYNFNTKEGTWASSTELDNIYGIDKTFVRTVNNWLKIVHPNFRDEMENHIKTHVIKNKNDLNKQYKIINQKTGNEHWVHALGSLKFNAENDTYIMFGTIQDITNFKKVELALLASKNLAEESEKRYKTLQEASFGGLIIHHQGKILDFNEGALKITGYTKEELFAINGLSLVIEEDRELIAEKFKSNIDEIYEVTGLRKNNEKYALRIEAKSMPYNGKLARIVELRDISDLKMSQAELVNTQFLLNETGNMAKIGGWEYTIATNSLFYTKETYNIYELPYDTAVDVELGIKYYIEKDQEIISNVFNECVEKGISFDLEAQIITANGNHIWVRSMGKPKYENGKLISVHGTIQNITSFKNIENQLIIEKENAVESEQRFKTLHEASLSGILIHDSSKVLDFNKGILDMSGYTSEELLNGDGKMLVAEEYREVLKRMYESQSEKPYEVIAVRKNGEKYPVQVEARNLPYKGKMVRMVEIRDISAIKDSQLALIQSQELLNETGRMAKTGGWEYVIETGEVYFSKETYNIHELSEETIIKVEVSYYTPEGQKIIEKVLDEAIKNNSTYDVELELITAKNNHIWVRTMGKPKFENGKLVSIIGSIQDITLQRKNKQELIDAKLSAEESNNLKTEFLNNMSHEIRTPMNGIIGFSDLLSTPNLSENKRENFIKIIQNSSKQLLRIIDDILEISRLGTKQITALESEVCLNDLLMDKFSIFDIEARKNKTSLYLKKALNSSQSTIFIDKTKLSKAISNLLENALKFTQEGFIEFGYKHKNENLEIYVKDTGIGIPQEKHAIIFERFQQAEKSLSRKVGGLGLGLSIVKENVEIIGGKIKLESTVGKGSIFTITIPYNPVNKLDINDLKNNDEKPSVLIVEDDEVNYILIETLIKNILKEKYAFIHAKNGLEAVNIFKKNDTIKLIFMDLKLPVMDGFKATKEIRKECPKIPIIAQTTFTSSKDKTLAKKVGCNDFLIKPIQQKDIEEVLNLYLNKK